MFYVLFWTSLRERETKREGITKASRTIKRKEEIKSGTSGCGSFVVGLDYIIYYILSFSVVVVLLLFLFFVVVFERENELETVQQLNFKDLWPELKCGLCEHHLRARIIINMIVGIQGKREEKRDVPCFQSCSSAQDINGQLKLQVGSKEQQTSHNQRFLIISSFLFDVTCERPLLFPLAFSRALSVMPQIIIRKTYVKELLINDVIILPHTQ